MTVQRVRAYHKTLEGPWLEALCKRLAVYGYTFTALARRSTRELIDKFDRERWRVRPRRYTVTRLHKQPYTIIKGETTIQRCKREAREEFSRVSKTYREPSSFETSIAMQAYFDRQVSKIFHRKLKEHGIQVEGAP